MAGRLFVASIVSLALTAVNARAQTPQPQIDQTPVYTICTLLVGTTAPGAEQQGVTMALSSAGFPALEAAQYAENLADLQEKLKATFRLDRLDVLTSFGDWMSPGREMVLEGPGTDLKLVVKAEGVTEQTIGVPSRGADGSVTFATTPGKKSANYGVRLTSGATVVLDRAWPVALGSRSILARQVTLNGAIYFIVIAAPLPGTPMRTSVGIQAQAYTIHQADKSGTASAGATGGTVGGASGGTGGAVAGGVSGSASAGGGVAGGITQMNIGGAGGTIRPPKLIHSIQPTLPPEARAAGIKGPVILTGKIAPNGYVQDIKVTKGVDGLTDLAIAAFRQWRYEPPALDASGTPVTIQISVVFPFRDEP
jgi:TonB family protein